MKKTPTQFALEYQEILNLFDYEYSKFDISNTNDIEKYKEHQINFHWWEYYERELSVILNEILTEPFNELNKQERKDVFAKYKYELSPTQNLLNSKADIKEEAIKLNDQLSEKEKYKIWVIQLINGMLVSKNIEAVSLYGAGFSMHDLFFDAKNNKNEDALFMAINIDSACIRTKTYQKFLSESCNSINHEDFIHKVSLAINKQYRSASIPYNTQKYREFSFYECVLRDYTNKDGTKPTLQEISEISVNHLKLFDKDINDDLIIKKISQLRAKTKKSRK